MDTGWWGHFLILYNDNFTFRNVYSFNDLGILKFYRLKFENCAGKWSCFKVKSCYSYYSYYCRLLWLLYYCYLWFLLYSNRIFRWETVGAVDGVLQVTSRWEEVTISARSLLTATTLLSLVSFDSYSVFYCSTRSRCFYLKKVSSREDFWSSCVDHLPDRFFSLTLFFSALRIEAINFKKLIVQNGSFVQIL